MIRIKKDLAMTIDLNKDINVIQNSEGVEKHLKPYKELLGDDYEGYRGHIYRILTYTLHFLGGESQYRKAIEAAFVYHDIGLWTDGKLNYLAPSAKRAREALKSEFNAEEMEIIDGIIMWHHKITPYKKGQNADVIDAARKADWIDASMGMVKKGMPKGHINKVQSLIANNGFHQTLKEFGPRLRGWNIFLMIWEMQGIMKL